MFEAARAPRSSLCRAQRARPLRLGSVLRIWMTCPPAASGAAIIATSRPAWSCSIESPSKCLLDPLARRAMVDSSPRNLERSPTTACREGGANRPFARACRRQSPLVQPDDRIDHLRIQNASMRPLDSPWRRTPAGVRHL